MISTFVAIFKKICFIIFRFSPCIFKVNHFYWPTNALNCI